jgi:formylglycine-generating enzyme required for sulfatase activity
MVFKVDNPEQKSEKGRRFGEWLRRRSIAKSLKSRYRFLLVLPLCLSIFLGYQIFYHVAGYQKQSISQVGAFYGVRIPGKGYLFPEMVQIPSGSFEMGSEDGEADEMPVHKVNVNTFELGRFEVTNAQWKAYCDATGKSYPPNPGLGTDYFLQKLNHPVINVSWMEAQDYCVWLSNLTGRHYRLPTEAEWEYAAQGSQTGCFSGNQPKVNPSTAMVGSFTPNRFGLYDMLGNAWEWCQDWYDPNYFKLKLADNPAGPKEGRNRVLRGGSWGDPLILCRVSNRIRFAPQLQYKFYGLRVAASIDR